LEYDVDVAGGGEEAVECATSQCYLAIFMDCEMPGMNGFQATAAIRKSGAEGTADVPIIALSAHAVDDNREPAMAAGMTECMTKPFMLGDVAEMLKKYQ